MYPGPNCFATALYGVGGIESFRGVSAREFSTFVKSSCYEVTNPQYGDIGYYYIDESHPSHAFFYIDPNQAFEKQGVDYLGATPLRFNSIVNIDYIHLASPECRRWGNKDCYSKFKYVRCKTLQVSKEFKNLLEELEADLEAKLISNKKLSPQFFQRYRSLQVMAESPYEVSVLKSIDLQLRFFTPIQ